MPKGNINFKSNYNLRHKIVGYAPHDVSSNKEKRMVEFLPRLMPKVWSSFIQIIEMKI